MSSTVQTAADGRPGTDGHVPALRPVGAPVTEAGLAKRAAEALPLAESLPARGVGLGPVYGVATADESFTTSTAVGGPGDPATDPGPAHAARPLPSSLEPALAALRRSEIIPEAMGAVFAITGILAVAAALVAVTLMGRTAASAEPSLPADQTISPGEIDVS